MDVAQLCVYGNVQVSTQALRELADLGIPVTFHTMSGYFIAMAHGLWHGNAHLRIAQHAAAADPARALPLARAFVAAKIRNQRVMLRRNDSPDERPDPGQTLDRLEELAESADTAESVATLLGLEGTAARLYFARFGGLLKMPGFDFNSRNRRPPRDPVNALLSFCYAILTRECHVALTASGFDPMVGFLHQPRYNRPALALDLMEEFRPIVADSVVMTLVNTGEIREDHFITRADSCALTEKGRKTVLVALERRLDSLVTHPVFGYRISYRRVIQVQARLVSRVLLGEIPGYPGFVTR
jgi:CRISPR-associated protein Cas1